MTTKSCLIYPCGADRNLQWLERQLKSFNVGHGSEYTVCIYVYMSFMALITALVLCDRSHDLLLSVSVHREHVVFSTAGFKGGGKSCPKTRETPALWRDIQNASRI